MAIKISSRVRNDLDEFVREKFKEALSDSDSANSAFEYLPKSGAASDKNKKKRGLTKQ